MKPRDFLLQLSLLTIGITNLPAQEVKQVDIIFDLDDFNIIYDGENTYSIEALNPDHYYPEDPSLPAIPLKSIRVLVPNGAEIMDFQIETVKDIVEKDIVLSKAPFPVPTNSLDYGEDVESEFKGIYPKNPVKFNNTLIQRGITWFSFSVSPFRYDGQNRELTFITKIKLKVDYVVSEEKASIIRQDPALVHS